MSTISWKHLPGALMPALLILPPPACATNVVTTLPGVELSWNDCGTAGAASLSFACDANTGTSTLVGSFVAPPGCDSVVAAEISVDLIEGGGAPIEPWWQCQAGGCRARSWAFSFDTGALDACAQPWNRDAIALGDARLVGGPGGPAAEPVMLRLEAVGAIPQGTQRRLEAGREYYCFTLAFDHARAGGPGACAGCATHACIQLASVRLDQVLGTAAGDFELEGPPPGGRDHVTWQGATAGEGCTIFAALPPAGVTTTGALALAGWRAWRPPDRAQGGGPR